MANPFDRARVVKTNNPFSKAKVITQNITKPSIPNLDPLNPSKESMSYYGSNPRDARNRLANEALGAVNTATFNIPRNAINYSAKKLGGIDQDIVPEGGKLGQLAGLLSAFGLTRGVLSKVAPKLMGRGILKGIGRGAIEGGIVSQAIEPGPESALVGAATGAVAEPLVAGAGNVYNATLGKKKFLKGVISEFKGGIKSKKGEFGKFLDEAKVKYPGRTADLTDAINELRVSRTYNPEVDSLINEIPDLKRLVDNPQLANQIPVDVTQDLINQFSKKIPQRALDGSRVTTADIPFIRGRESLKESQATAFPEILPQRKSYSLTKRVERKVGRGFEPETVESKLEKGFPTLVEENIENVLGKEFVKKLKGYKQASGVVNIATNPYAAGGAGVLGYGALKLKDILSKRKLD